MSDLISRQALRDAMYHEAFETDTEMQRWDNGCWIRYKLFENVIDNLPSAEQKERRKGKWIEHKNPKDVFSIECSECRCWFLHKHLVRNSFCPNCGARMNERRENDKG